MGGEKELIYIYKYIRYIIIIIIIIILFHKITILPPPTQYYIPRKTKSQAVSAIFSKKNKKFFHKENYK